MILIVGEYHKLSHRCSEDKPADEISLLVNYSESLAIPGMSGKYRENDLQEKIAGIIRL